MQINESIKDKGELHMEIKKMSNLIENQQILINELKKQNKQQMDEESSKIVQMLTTQQKSLDTITNQTEQQIDNNSSKILQQLKNQQNSINEIKKQNKQQMDEESSKIIQMLTTQQKSLDTVTNQTKQQIDIQTSKILQQLTNQQNSLNELGDQNKQYVDSQSSKILSEQKNSIDIIKKQNLQVIEEKIIFLKKEIENYHNKNKCQTDELKQMIKNQTSKPYFDENILSYITETLKEIQNNPIDSCKCPGCNCAIIKDGGCDHMTCPKCYQQFCNLCGSKWEGHSADSDEYKRKQEFQIFVKDINGKILTLNIRSRDQTETLRKKISEKIGIDASTIRITYGGKQIEDGNPVSQYGIQKNSTLITLLRLRGGND